jgi:hypothetical protein
VNITEKIDEAFYNTNKAQTININGITLRYRHIRDNGILFFANGGSLERQYYLLRMLESYNLTNVCFSTKRAR